jgi:sulfate transport system permease protein
MRSCRPSSPAPAPAPARAPRAGNIIGKTQTLTLFVESAYKEYNTEAAFAAAVLLSFLALATLFVKDKVEAAAAAESMK